jgi:hypothetical protein
MNYWSEDYIKSLGEEYRKQEGIEQNITIPFGILAFCGRVDFEYTKDGLRTLERGSTNVVCRNNDVFAITDCHILEKICNSYKEEILDKPQMVELFLKKWNDKSLDKLRGGRDSASATEILHNMFWSGHRNIFLHTLNLGLINFNLVVSEVIKNKTFHEFDLVANGGKYCSQDTYAYLSWCNNIYIDVKQNEQQPSTLVDVNSLENPVLSKNHPLVK